MSKNYINGEWKTGQGAPFDSVDPAAQDVIWTGHAANDDDVAAAFTAARNAFDAWSITPIEKRMAIVEKYKELAIAAKPAMAKLIARETGKVLWDATGEASALSAKVEISLRSYQDRTGQSTQDTAFGRAELQHRAHGVMAVLGPYNFPAHLPNGQIIPALIAGNTVVFKPSEQTPAVGEALIRLYAEAGFPKGVINMVQGARQVGAAIIKNPEVDGLLFTGSPGTGAFIHKHFGGRPEVILALEMGGNNPLIVWDTEDVKAAASLAVQSAYITSGQRCTCTRRLIIPDNRWGEQLIEEIHAQTQNLTLGSWEEGDNVSTGPLVSAATADYVVKKAAELADAGGTVIKPTRISDKGPAFVEPGIYDVTGCVVEDEEIFGPVLKVIRVKDWDAAIAEANNTKYGLAAGLVSDDTSLWTEFKCRIKAGVVNFNRPTTGAASFLPFGGPGASGNHNPGAYYSADFCAWPMASQVADAPEYMPIKGQKS